MAMAHGEAHLTDEQDLQLEHRHEHPGNAEYVRIAIILAVITIGEVIIWYATTNEFILDPLLIIMSIAKFLIVVGFFMHLKFDNRIFRYVFFFGLSVALFVFIATGVIFSVHRVVSFYGGLTG